MDVNLSPALLPNSRLRQNPLKWEPSVLSVRREAKRSLQFDSLLSTTSYSDSLCVVLLHSHSWTTGFLSISAMHCDYFSPSFDVFIHSPLFQLSELFCSRSLEFYWVQLRQGSGERIGSAQGTTGSLHSSHLIVRRVVQSSE
jgi:hypothetical protein